MIFTVSLIILTLLTYVSEIRGDDIKIKSLRVYSSIGENYPPIIIADDLKRAWRFYIEFDAQADYEPNLSMVFRFCDKNWRPYVDNPFLWNESSAIVRNLRFLKLPNSVKGARYYFKGIFPDESTGVSFPFSGKWRFYIVDSQDTSKIFESGKFIYVRPKISITSTISRERLTELEYFGATIREVFSVSTKFQIPEFLYPFNVDRVEIVENFKFDYPEIIDKNSSGNFRFYTWNASKDFTFTARNIIPTNEYRRTDLRNYNKIVGPDVNAQFDGLEIMRMMSDRTEDYNGGSVLLNPQNDYAEYLNVLFKLRLPDNSNKRVFLTGAFNKWTIDEEYEMFKNNGLYSIKLELKRGAYDYQYVSAEIRGGEIVSINWSDLEGNNFNVKNNYFIFVYYKNETLGGFDEIIGAIKINTGVL